MTTDRASALRLIEDLRQYADALERIDPHHNIGTSMTLTYAADSMREAAALLAAAGTPEDDLSPLLEA